MSGNLTSPSGIIPPTTRPQVPGESFVRRAWISLVFYVLSFIASFAIGEGLLALYGYEEDESTPVWVGLGVLVPALLVFSLPGLFAVYYGRKALRQGNRAGLPPAIIGAAIALGIVVLNVVGGLVG